jgi:hypothetical protein
MVACRLSAERFAAGGTQREIRSGTMKRASLATIALLTLGVMPALTASASDDTTPPTLRLPPYAAFVVGSSIGPSAELPADPQPGDYSFFTFDIKELAKWRARDASGICGYDIATEYAGTAPTPILEDTMKTKYAVLGSDYVSEFGGGSFDVTGLRVTAYDCAGNSTWKTIGTRAIVSQESDTALTYKGAWSTSDRGYLSGGHSAKTKQRGASVTINVDSPSWGDHLALVMEKGPNRGKAAVYIDGNYKKTINTYSAKTRHRVIMFDTVLPAGPHTIKLVNKATCGHPRIEFDAVLTHRGIVPG